MGIVTTYYSSLTLTLSLLQDKSRAFSIMHYLPEIDCDLPSLDLLSLVFGMSPRLSVI